MVQHMVQLLTAGMRSMCDDTVHFRSTVGHSKHGSTWEHHTISNSKGNISYLSFKAEWFAITIWNCLTQQNFISD